MLHGFDVWTSRKVDDDRIQTEEMWSHRLLRGRFKHRRSNANSPYHASNNPEENIGIHRSCIPKQSHISDNRGVSRQDGCQGKQRQTPTLYVQNVEMYYGFKSYKVLEYRRMLEDLIFIKRSD